MSRRFEPIITNLRTGRENKLSTAVKNGLLTNPERFSVSRGAVLILDKEYSGRRLITTKTARKYFDEGKFNEYVSDTNIGTRSYEVSLEGFVLDYRVIKPDESKVPQGQKGSKRKPRAVMEYDGRRYNPYKGPITMILGPEISKILGLRTGKDDLVLRDSKENPLTQLVAYGMDLENFVPVMYTVYEFLKMEGLDIPIHYSEPDLITIKNVRPALVGSAKNVVDIDLYGAPNGPRKFIYNPKITYPLASENPTTLQDLWSENIIEHAQPNKCLATHIISRYDNQEGFKKQRLTYKLLEEKYNIKGGTTMKEASSFFFDNHIHLVAYDRFMNCQYNNEDVLKEKYGKLSKWKKSFVCVVQDNHVYPIDGISALRGLGVKRAYSKNDDEEEEDELKEPTSNYYIDTKYRLDDTIIIENFEDIVAHPEIWSSEEPTEVNVLTKTDIKRIMYILAKKIGYLVRYNAKLECIYFKIKNTVIIVRNDNNLVRIGDEKTYREMSKYHHNLKKEVISHTTLSHYHINWLKTATSFCGRAISSRFPEGTETTEHTEWDFVKFYSSILQSLPSFYVLDKFSAWRRCSEIQYYANSDNTIPAFYIVSLAEDDYEIVDGRYAKKVRPGYIQHILFKDYYMIFTDYDLKEIDPQYYQIHYVTIVPVTVPTDKYVTAVSEFNKAFGEDETKLSINIVIGMLEKTKNQNKARMLYQSLDEVNGEAFRVQVTSEEDEYNHKIDDSDPLYYTEKTSMPVAHGNGFFPITIQKYSRTRLLLAKLFRYTESLGLTIHGINSDAIYTSRVDDMKEEVVMIDGFRVRRRPVEKEFKMSSCRNSEKRYLLPTLPTKHTEYTLVSEPEWKENGEKYISEFLDIVSDENVTVYKGVINPRPTKKRILIKATIAGAGKSYLCNELYRRKFAENAVILTQNNKRRIRIKRENPMMRVRTLCRQLMVEPHSKLSDGCYKLPSDIRMVIIEEFFSFSISDLQRITKLMEENDTVLFVCNGDIDQNRVDPKNLTLNTQYYYTVIAETVFDIHIRLNISKRMASEDDRKQVERIHHYLFEEGHSLHEMMNNFKFNYISNISEIPKNSIVIAYTNQTCYDINNHFFKGQPKPGDKIVCKTHFRSKVYTNTEYIVINVNENTLDIRTDVDEDDEEFFSFTISISEFQRFFTFAFAMTSHSTQGDTYPVGTPVVFCDISNYFTTIESFYTTYTRVCDLNDFYILKTNKHRRDPQYLSQSNIASMIENYKTQDKNAGRVIPSTFVDVEGVQKLLRKNRSCFHCSCDFDDTNKPTLDRINDSHAHTHRNVIVSCVDCNRHRKNLTM